MAVNSILRAAALFVVATALSGCSIKTMAINTVGSALADSGSGYASDDDPELIAAAVPFGLKTIEGLLAQSPRNKGLLFAACSGFTRYSYAFVQEPADYLEAQDLEKATEMRTRAKRLFLRARDYGFRGFDVEFAGFSALLRKDPDAALRKLTRKHVGLLYYTGASWAAAYSIDITDAQLATDQSLIEKVMHRALVLDETWNAGAIHDFFVAWEAAHASGGAGGSLDEAKKHFERSQQLAAGRRISQLVTYAESVLTAEHDRKDFESLLNQVVSFNVETGAEDQRLANVLAQRRAKWLLGRVEELF